jgi:hypothetical protein
VVALLNTEFTQASGHALRPFLELLVCPLLLVSDQVWTFWKFLSGAV